MKIYIKPYPSKEGGFCVHEEGRPTFDWTFAKNETQADRIANEIANEIFETSGVKPEIVYESWF